MPEQSVNWDLEAEQDYPTKLERKKKFKEMQKNLARMNLKKQESEQKLFEMPLEQLVFNSDRSNFSLSPREDIRQEEKSPEPRQTEQVDVNLQSDSPLEPFEGE